MIYTKHKILRIDNFENNEELLDELNELSKDGWKVLGITDSLVLTGLLCDDDNE